MDPITTPAGTPAAPPAAAPALAPVVGTTTGESFMPAGAPGTPAAAPAAATPAPAAAPAPAAPGGAAGKRVTMAQDELKERIRRAQSTVLKDLLGTDDPTAIRERLSRVEALEKANEEAARAAMTEQQKLQHDLTKARAEASRWRTELAMSQEREVVREQGSFVERIAGKHVNPQALEEASLAFARKVATTDPKVVAKWTERNIDEWFKKYVETKPFMGKQAASAPAPQRRVERAPGGAASPPPRPRQPASGDTNGGKTFRPGQPNSMSKSEARDEMRRRGYSY